MSSRNSEFNLVLDKKYSDGYKMESNASLTSKIDINAKKTNASKGFAVFILTLFFSEATSVYVPRGSLTDFIFPVTEKALGSVDGNSLTCSESCLLYIEHAKMWSSLVLQSLLLTWGLSLLKKSSLHNSIATEWSSVRNFGLPRNLNSSEQVCRVPSVSAYGTVLGLC